MRAGAMELGYTEVWVGSYGTLEVGLPHSVPQSLLVDAWGPGDAAPMLHPDDPEQWRWHVSDASCTAIATLADDHTATRLAVVDDRGSDER